MRSRFPALFLCAALCLSLAAVPHPQDGDGDSDKFVRLMSAQSVRLLEIDGKAYRKADGPARFFHNNTWLICDTALWNVDEQVIFAIGNVAIQQEQTELKSDRLTYYAERNIAEFRGSLVQLKDKDNNMLRTHNLDYNTKDSVAVFRDGGAMKDKDGQIMESNTGTYDSKARLFTFQDEVNMFTDSVFIRTQELMYDSNKSLATFPVSLYAWKSDNMLASESGWYDRSKEIFLFKGDVHVMSPTQEGWCDSLFYEKKFNNLTMLGNAQATDDERSVTAMGGRIHYVDSLKRVQLQRKPLVAMATEDSKTGKVDTVYFGADSIRYWTVKRNEVDSVLVENAKARLKSLDTDPVANVRAKAAEEAKKKMEEAIQNDPNLAMEREAKEKAAGAAKTGGGENAVGDEAETAQENDEEAAAKALADSLAKVREKFKADSLFRVDSIAAANDTSGIGFLEAVHNVKVYRTDMQMKCDSLLYCDLDSLARLFDSPYVWNERGSHQYSADSIYVNVKDKRIDKAYLMGNSFIHVEEVKGKYYDQIRAAEMTAFFDENAELRRFDAMGGANALFFLQEDGRHQTANKSEATLLTAVFKDGQLNKLTYYESPKSDVFPIAQMAFREMQLKGYDWKPELRPYSSRAISPLHPRLTQRSRYDGIGHCSFTQTDIYFPGYMAGVYVAVARSDSLSKVRRTERDNLMQNNAVTVAVPVAAAPSFAADSAAVAVDSTALAAGQAVAKDSLTASGTSTTGTAAAAASTVPGTVAATSAAVAGADAATSAAVAGTAAAPLSSDKVEAEKQKDPVSADSLAVSDSTSAPTDSLTPKQRERLAKLAALEAARKARQAVADSVSAAKMAARDSVWARKDRADAEKAAAKAAKKKEKKDAKIRATQERLMAQKAKEDAILEKYRQRYRKRSKYLKDVDVTLTDKNITSND